jgi:hypothetical protein
MKDCWLTILLGFALLFVFLIRLVLEESVGEFEFEREKEEEENDFLQSEVVVR